MGLISKSNIYIVLGFTLLLIVVSGGVFLISDLWPSSPSVDPAQVIAPTTPPSNTLEGLIVTRPQKLAVLPKGESIRVDFNTNLLETVSVYVRPFIDSCEGIKGCPSTTDTLRLTQYEMGEFTLNRGYIEIPTDNISQGRYQIDLVQGTKTVLQSPVFALIDPIMKPFVDIHRPTAQEVITKNMSIVRWSSSSDIFYINLVLENDTERRYITKDYPNTGQYEWDLTDDRNRVFSSGDYALIIENSLTKQRLAQVSISIE